MDQNQKTKRAINDLQKSQKMGNQTSPDGPKMLIVKVAYQHYKKTSTFHKIQHLVFEEKEEEEKDKLCSS